MLEILLILFLPLVSLAIARGRTKSSVAAAEYFLYAAVLFALTMAVMVPTGLVTVRGLEYGYTVARILYGKSAMLFALALSVALGAGVRLLRKHVLRERVTPLAGKGFLWHAAYLLCGALLFFILFATLAFRWGLRYYGNVSFDEIIFHMNMPLEGTSVSFFASLTAEALVPACALFALPALMMYWPTRFEWRIGLQGGRRLLRIFPLRLPIRVTAGIAVLWLALLYVAADGEFQITSYIANQLRQSSFIEDHYVDPRSVRIAFPEEKRNLITIYLESAETSSQDTENGGFFDVNYIPEMTALAKEHISFSHSDKLEGAAVAPATGWTISALVAQSAGLPLKLFRYDDTSGGADNAMSRYAYFLPGAVTLGDLLREQGYRTVYMAGSDFTFGGRRAYYTQHGDYEVYDYLAAKEQGVIPQDYNENWGFEDRKLYAWAKEVLEQLAAQDRPFHFAMLTIDTHAPDGYTCDICPPSESGHAYESPLRCSARQVAEFVAWCQAQPFFENTTIVITGDHSSMVPDFYGGVEYEKHSGDTQRKIYNVFIHSAVKPVQEKNRLFTTMDFFATTLAAMGVQIEGDRLALSTNLFSDRQTLAEEYGYETMFEEMDKKSVFYNERILYP